MTLYIISGLTSFLGAATGAYFGTRLAWRRDFVTRDEMIELARVINRDIKSLRETLRAAQQ